MALFGIPDATTACPGQPRRRRDLQHLSSARPEGLLWSPDAAGNAGLHDQLDAPACSYTLAAITIDSGLRHRQITRDRRHVRLRRFIGRRRHPRPRSTRSSGRDLRASPHGGHRRHTITLANAPASRITPSRHGGFRPDAWPKRLSVGRVPPDLAPTLRPVAQRLLRLYGTRYGYGRWMRQIRLRGEPDDRGPAGHQLRPGSPLGRLPARNQLRHPRCERHPTRCHSGRSGGRTTVEGRRRQHPLHRRLESKANLPDTVKQCGGQQRRGGNLPDEDMSVQLSRCSRRATRTIEQFSAAAPSTPTRWACSRPSRSR